MMDKTYILEENLLERYVLGELNAEEEHQIEVALNKFPELKDELSSIEANIESMTFENAIQPASKVKSQLLHSISNRKTEVIPIQNHSSKNPYLVAASIAALFLMSSIFLYSKWNTSQEQIRIVERQNYELNKKLDKLQKDNEKTQALFTSINNPDTEKYVLKGNALMPEAKLISYVNDKEKSVIVNTAYLPDLDNEHDYQMWADVNGEMINMGIIDTNQEMLAMTYIDYSESLNITIEPSGGSDHPTVSKLITNIYLK